MLYEQRKGVMRHDVYSDVLVGMFIFRRNELKPKAFSQGAPIMLSTEFAFQFFSPWERGFPPPLWSIEYGTRVMTSLIDAVNHYF